MEDIAASNEIRMWGFPQIATLTVAKVARIIRDTLPRNWQRGQEVEWTPERNRHPPKTWLEQCWKVFNNDFTKNLEVFFSLPLIPKRLNAMKIRMMPIRNDSCLISACNPLTSRPRPMDSKVEALLERIGLEVVHLPSYIDRHPQLYNKGFVHYPTLEGVVKALMALSESEISRSLKQLFPADKNTLRDFMNTISYWPVEMSFEERKRYSMLPIFKSFPNKELVPASNIGKVIKVTEDLPHFATTDTMIGLYDSTDYILSSVLKLKTCSTDEAIHQMLDNVSSYNMNDLINWIFNRWSNIQNEDLRSRFTMTSFLKTSDGSLKRPCDLFDPTDDDVAALWDEDEGVFPVEYLDKRHMYILRELGLKNCQEITINDVISRARRIEAKCEQAKAVNLLILLNKRTDLISNDIKNIKWVPVMCKPKTYPLTWGCVEKMAKPSEILTSEHMYLAGSSAALVPWRATVFTNSFLKIFPWNKLPRVGLVIKQLEICIRLWKNGQSDFNNPIENTILCEIYTYLQERLGYVEEQLSEMPWVWQGNRFVEAQKVSTTPLEFDMSPYVYHVPYVFSKFKWLFLSCGAYQQMDTNVMLNIIHKIKDKHMKTQQTKKAVKNDQRFIIKIISHLFSEEEANEMDNNVIKKILLPTNDTDNLRLHLVSEMCYRDINYQEEDLTEDNQLTPILLTHGDIPHNLCIRLGITPLSKRIQQSIHTCTIQKLNSCELFSAFGQHEEISSRIQHILKDHPYGITILRELLQNADDAGASKLSLILDYRNHPVNGLPSPNWEDLQGPALCVYNNAVFTDDDIQGIQKLGSGSKAFQTQKTGEHGIGFNIVYHVTDCPSFISDGEILCFFDPNLEYAPGATPCKPGLITKKIQETRKEYPNVMKCYLNEFEQDFPQRGGTIFRLPLRSSKMAKLSKINNKVITEIEIKELLKEFENEMPEILLFLKNIRRISVHEIGLYGELFERYSVESIIRSDREEEERGSFLGAIKEFSLNTPPIDEFREINCSYVIEILCHKAGKEISKRWLISQSFGIEGTDPMLLSHLPIGGVGILLPEREGNRYIGQNHCSVYCLLPLPIKIGLPVIVNGHFCLGQSRRDIWNDDDDQNDPRVAWNNKLITVVISRAYLNLLSAFAKRIGLIGSPINEISHRYLEGHLSDYHRLFPNPSKASSSLWKKLAISFYKRIVHQNEPVLPVLRDISSATVNTTLSKIKWCSPVGNYYEKGYFYEVDVYRKKKEVMELISLLIRLGINVLCAPSCIHDFFEAAGCQVGSVTPNVVCEFLLLNHQKSIVEMLPLHISKTTLKTEDDLKTLLKYICTQPFGLHPHGLPLVITEDKSLNVCDCQNKSRKLEPMNDFNSRLCTFRGRHIFYCRFAKVFSECKHEFLNIDFVKYFDCSKFKCLSLTDIEERLEMCLNPTEYNIRSYIHYDSDILKPDWIRDLWECIFASWKHAASTDKSGHIILDENILLQTFQDWAILPVLFKNKPFLFSLSMAASVGNISQDRQLYEILNTKLKSPTINRKLLPVDTPGAIYSLLSSTKHPDRIMSLLLFLQEENEHCFTVLKPNDCSYLLNYFERNISYVPNNRLSRLKELKLFETISGDIVNLTDKQVVMMCDNFPEVMQSIFIGSAQTVFIKSQPQLKQLHTKLSSFVMSSLEVYTTFILPCFSDFTNEEREVHLRWVRELRLNEQELYSYGFTSSPIMKTDRGFQRVNTLFDPKNELFQRMLPMQSFPTCPYNAPEWRGFLLNLGLISELNPDLFIKFARMVEFQISSNIVQSKTKSKALVSVLRSQLQCDSSLLHEISTIKFMVPDNLEVMRLFPVTYRTTKNGVMFRGSVTFIYAHLMWTIKKVLPKYADVDKVQGTELGVIQDPKTEEVLMHLRNISTNTERRLPANDEVKIKEVYSDIYAFLNGRCRCNDEPCDECQSIMKIIPSTLAFVLVHNMNGSMLVQASMVSQNVPKEIKDVLIPYIYELPKEYVQYKNVFKAAGMTDEVSVKQYSIVLETIFQADKTGARNPNFRKVVAGCVRGMFEILKNSERNEIERDFESVNCLYFPDKMHTLISSRDLVYGDVCRYERRIKNDSVRLFIGFKELNMDGSYYSYLDNLPQRMQLQKMSKEFREEMLVTESKECPDSKNGHCQFLDTYKTVLTSHEFRQGLMRLINHEKMHSYFDKEKKEQKINNIFGQSLKLHCKEIIKTRLYFHNTLLSDSEGTVECCLKKTEQENGLYNYDIYMRHYEHPGSKPFTKTFVTIINEILENDISDILCLQGILTEPSPFTIDDTLSQFNITFYENRPYQPIPGDSVPVGSLYLLSQDPFDIFYEGEIVAYHSLNIVDNNSDAHYIYAKVKWKVTRPNVSALTCLYAIDIGKEAKGLIEVSMLDIFKFLKPNIATGLQMVPYEGNDSQSTSYESSMDEVKQQIVNKLQAIWRLPDSERRKAIKRILLKWHPDKNEEDRKEFYTEMFQFITDVIKSRRYDERKTATSFDDEFFDEINLRAQRDHTCFRSQSGHFAAQPRPSWPDLSEARRWMRQAKIDLLAAETEENCFCEWICFKCSQAAEKAFKAVQYAINGQKGSYHCIRSLACAVETQIDLTSASTRLASAVGNHMRTRYPDQLSRGKIPNDVYSIAEAEESKSAAREIVDRISEFLINKGVNIT